MLQKVQSGAKTTLSFGGRVLLCGPAGTDFDAFSQKIAIEMPLKTISFRMRDILQNLETLPESITAGIEFARRNSPAILYISRLELLGKRESVYAAVLEMELKETSWVDDEVLVIACTTQPEDIDRHILSLFDHTYIFDASEIEDRVRLFEESLEGFKSIQPRLLAGVTEGWTFTDSLHLATSLLLRGKDEKEPVTKEELEKRVRESGVVPLGRKESLDAIAKRTSGSFSPGLKSVESVYPDDFLDQLYLMAVSENFQGVQQVIETLNSNLPLSAEDRILLNNYPFLLQGEPDDRLTRLMRAKRSLDRLSRIMGR